MSCGSLREHEIPMWIMHAIFPEPIVCINQFYSNILFWCDFYLHLPDNCISRNR